jgi:hypothetical protein
VELKTLTLPPRVQTAVHHYKPLTAQTPKTGATPDTNNTDKNTNIQEETTASDY